MFRNKKNKENFLNPQKPLQFVYNLTANFNLSLIRKFQNTGK